MKHSTWGTVLLALVAVAPVPALAQVNVQVGIGLPPPVVFAAEPELVVIPETYVYAIPDVDADIYFYDGWWWRLWNGRWYRSRSYATGWLYYQSVPWFYARIPTGWRNDYHNRRWGGHTWNYQRIPHRHVQQNWSHWERSRHWENQHTWGVQGLQPRAQWRELPGATNPQHQQRPQAQQRAQEGYNPQYQQRQGQPEGYNPQNRQRPPTQARPPEGNVPDLQRQQAQPRPQEGYNPQNRSRPQAQPGEGRPQYQPPRAQQPQVVTAAPPAPAVQPPPAPQAAPQAPRAQREPRADGQPREGRPDAERGERPDRQ